MSAPQVWKRRTLGSERRNGLSNLVYPASKDRARTIPGGTVVKNLPANAGEARNMGSILASGRSSGVGNDNPLQYSCLENPTDKRTWWATAHVITKCQI